MFIDAFSSYPLLFTAFFVSLGCLILHVYRCVLLAHELGITCTGIGARVAPYYWPSAVIREFAAVYSRRKHLLPLVADYLLFIVLPLYYMWVNGYFN